MSTKERSTHAAGITAFLAKHNLPVDGSNLSPKLANALQVSPSTPAHIGREIKVETLTATTPANTKIILIQGFHVACNRRASHLYLRNLSAEATISELDIETLTTSHTYAEPDWQPNTQAFSLDDNLIYLNDTHSSKMWLIDTLAQKVAEGAALERGTMDLFLTPDGKNLLHTGGLTNGYLQVIDASTQQLVTTISTAEYPFALTTNSDGSLAYVACWTNNDGSDFSTIQAFDTTTWQLKNSLIVRNLVFAMATNPRNKHLYLVNFTGSEFTVIDTDSNEVIKRILVANLPESLCVSPDGKYIYIQNFNSIITVIDAETLTTVENINTTKSRLSSITVSPKTADVFVTYIN